MILHLNCITALILVTLVMVTTYNNGNKSSPENSSNQTVVKAKKPNTMQSQSIEEERNNSKRVVIIGASYVEGWNIHTIANMTVVNKGISGETSIEILNRFDQDVISLKPFAVIIWGCINDIFNANQEEIESTLNKTKKNFIAMVKLARDNDIIPILTTELTIRSKSNWSEIIANWMGKILRRESYQDYINKHVLAINKWIIEYAKTQDIMLLDFHTTLSEEKGIRKKEYAVEDGSHISPKGYEKLTSYTKKILVDYLSR
jgi:lysophospholipase L1-like esterase